MAKPCPHEAVITKWQTWCRHCGALAVGDVWVSLPAERLRDLEAKFDCWRLVVTAAQEFAKTHAAWLEQVKLGPVSPTDEVVHRQAAATATLLLYVRDLDAKDAWAWICGCGEPTALTRCRTCGMDRPPRPEETADG